MRTTRPGRHMKATYEVDAVLFEREPGNWVAQCLQYDIGAQAKNVPDLIYELQRSLVGHVAIAIDNGLEPFESLPAAPQEYWDMFKQATVEVQTEEVPFRVPKAAPSVAPRCMKLAA